MKDVFSNLVIVKRSGQRVDFNGIKIAIAIKKAFDSVYDDNREKDINKVYESVLNYIEENFSTRKTITVEQIQDIIEDKLKEEKFPSVHSAFSEYRKRRTISRNMFMEKQQHKFIKAVEKIVENNFESNSNLKSVDIINGFGNIIANEYSKAYILDNKYVRLHDAGSIYIHNITDILLGIPQRVHPIINFEDYMSEDNLCELITLLLNYQKEVKSEVTINNLDSLLSLWITKKYYKLLIERVKSNLKLLGFYEFINYKEIENMLNNKVDIDSNIDLFKNYCGNKEIEKIFLNAIDTSYEDIVEITKMNINQLLTTLNNNCKDNFVYTISIGHDTTRAGKLISQLLLDELMIQNRLNHIAIIYKVRKIDDKQKEKIGILISHNKKIVISNSNEDKLEHFIEGKKTYDNILDDEKTSSGKMIIASVSINMARLGIKYHDVKMNLLYEELDDLLQQCKNELLSVFNYMANKTKNNYEVLFNNNILDDEKIEVNQKIRKSIKNGCLNIELIGLKECCYSLQNENKDENKILNELLKHIRNEINNMIEEHKLNFILSETTNKNILKNIITYDKAIYGSRKNITDKNSYQTINSTFSDYKCSEKIKEIAKYFNGGLLYKVEIAKNSSLKKIEDILDNLISSNIEIFEICLEKGET